MDTATFKLALPIALAIIMFGMGLGLTLSDFARVFTKPLAFVVGLFLQIVVLPAIAVTILFLMPLAAPLAVGLMILAACPGGVTSNLLTYISRGDVALSVSLTAVISLLGFVTVPLITGWALTTYMGGNAPEIPIAKTMIGILAITTVPVMIGMTFRRFAPNLTDKMEKLVGPLSFVVFFAVLFAAIYQERENLVSYLVQSGMQTLLLNIATMVIAAAAGLIIGLGRKQRAAIILECGLQNGTLGLVVAVTILGRTDMSIPIAIYSLLMFFSGFGYALWARSKLSDPDKKSGP